ncbi:hypothetical protein SDC9_108814 [bioreactor metagenome]|uniref:Uncharacterized protein n=1 Tax=bioreactor metagenome TaxID=1076179 RepID=A0A645B916_9ZZZZ
MFIIILKIFVDIAGISKLKIMTMVFSMQQPEIRKFTVEETNGHCYLISRNLIMFTMINIYFPQHYATMVLQNLVQIIVLDFFRQFLQVGD